MMESDPTPTKPTVPSDQPESMKESLERMWTSRGIEDVFFQREAQVTWWTVLGGIAVAAVLTQVESIPEAIAAGKWYCLLYCLAILLVIINSWVQTAWGSLVLKWPLSIPTSVSLFFQGIAMSIAGLNITRPSIWYASLAVVLISAVFDQLFFSRTHGWIALSEDRIVQVKLGLKIYSGLLVYVVLAAVALALWPVPLLELILGIIALITSILALVWQHIGMSEEKKQLNIA